MCLLVAESSKFWLEIPPETPAFVCERVGVEMELCRLADMTIVEDLSRQRRNMLYVSRGQLKKHSNTALNISVSVRYIAQQVSNVNTPHKINTYKWFPLFFILFTLSQFPILFRNGYCLKN